MLTYEPSSLISAVTPCEEITVGTLVRLALDKHSLGCVVDLEEGNVGYAKMLYYRVIWCVEPER